MKMEGLDPYGSPFGNPLPSLFCYFGISLRLPNSEVVIKQTLKELLNDPLKFAEAGG